MGYRKLIASIIIAESGVGHRSLHIKYAYSIISTKKYVVLFDRLPLVVTTNYRYAKNICPSRIDVGTPLFFSCGGGTTRPSTHLLRRVASIFAMAFLHSFCTVIAAFASRFFINRNACATTHARDPRPRAPAPPARGPPPTAPPTKTPQQCEKRIFFGIKRRKRYRHPPTMVGYSSFNWGFLLSVYTYILSMVGK